MWRPGDSRDECSSFGGSSCAQEHGGRRPPSPGDQTRRYLRSSISGYLRVCSAVNQARFRVALRQLPVQLLTFDVEIGQDPLRRGQEAGELRTDLTVEDVPTFVAMVTAASVALEQPAALRRRFLSLMLDALNPADAQPLPPLADHAP